MDNKKTFTAKTVEEAVSVAAAEMGVSVDEIKYTVIQEEKKSLFFSKPAVIEICDGGCCCKKTDSDRCALVENYLRSILDNMDGKDAKIEVSETKSGLSVVISGDDIAFLIGRRGETLDSLQYLTSLVVNRHEQEYVKITLDINNYREKREATLRSLGKKIARQVVRTGRAVTLEPMNPNERRIIHSAVQGVDGASSSSIGEEPYRKVVISSDNKAPRKKKTPQHNKNYQKHNEPRVVSEDSIIKDDFLKSETSIERTKKTIEEEYSTPLYTKIDL